MKTFAVTVMLLVCATWAGVCSAGQPIAPPADVPVIQVDWQVPQSLPPRFRNHCAYDHFSGRPYCSDHCGSEYQFFFCSRESFGCCRLGFGYCDWSGLLRCHP
jgi:hypothetical protein